MRGYPSPDFTIASIGPSQGSPGSSSCAVAFGNTSVRRVAGAGGVLSSSVRSIPTAAPPAAGGCTFEAMSYIGPNPTIPGKNKHLQCCV